MAESLKPADATEYDDSFLPFSYAGRITAIERPEQMKPHSSDVFYFTSKGGKKYVFKVTRSSFNGAALGKPEKAAKTREIVYRIVRKHYEKSAVDTYHIVAADQEGHPCVIAVQPYVEGQRLQSKTQDAEKANIRIKALMATWDGKVLQDMGWFAIEQPARHAFQKGDFVAGNFIRKENGNLKMIDW